MKISLSFAVSSYLSYILFNKYIKTTYVVLFFTDEITKTMKLYPLIIPTDNSIETGFVKRLYVQCLVGKMDLRFECGRLLILTMKGRHGANLA